MQDCYSRGRDQYKIGNFNQALVYFKKAIEKDPNNVDYLFALGKTYSFRYNSEENDRQSLYYYDKVLEINPKHIKTIIEKSLTLLNLGENSEALKIIDESINNFDDGYLWAMKGCLLAFLHEKGELIEDCFQRAFELSEDNSYSYYMRARAYKYDLEYKKASEYYDRSIEGLNDSVCDLDEGIYMSRLLTLLEKGWMYISSGNYDKALDCFENVLEISSKSVAGLYSKANVYYRQGDSEDALNVLNHSLYLDPDDILSLILKAFIYNFQGSPQTALKIYQRILEIDPNYGLALMSVSYIYYEKKEFEKAFNIAKIALEIEPMNDFALYFGALSARKMGYHNLARKWERELSDPRVKTIYLEKNLQDKIINEAWRLKKAGHDLKFKEREFFLKDRPGRLDLLYQDINTGDLVVIELKIVKATKKTYEQIKNYMDSISKTIGSGKGVKGIVISFGQDETFKNLVNNDADISYIDYQNLGLG